MNIFIKINLFNNSKIFIKNFINFYFIIKKF